MNQYIELNKRILRDGVDIYNSRTDKFCRTVIGANFEYDATTNTCPVDTTRVSYPLSAIAEMIGYIRGYDNAKDFAELGTRTWGANANSTPAWLANPHRAGENHIGYCYGAMANQYPKLDPDGKGGLEVVDYIDTLDDVYQSLLDNNDHRRLIWSFINPGAYHMGCLRPCMHTHTFSLLGDDLYLSSSQASVDSALGLNFNMVQVWFLLRVMAQITGKNAKLARHDLVNCHLYEDHIDSMRDIQIKREPRPFPTLDINPEIQTLEDLRTWVTMDDFTLSGYDPHPAIKYTMAV